jgi:hypothetical protein
VDMFPHTEHCEAVVLLKRCSVDEATRMKENHTDMQDEDLEENLDEQEVALQDNELEM